jgi:hypothetical protein
MLEPNFDEEFNETNTAEETPVGTEEKKSNNIGALKKQYAAFLAKEPGIKEKRNSASKSIEIVQVLGYGADNGNIIVDKELKAQTGDRKLKGVSKIVGYAVKNVGATPINVVTEKYAQDANGVYVGTPAVESLNPGETINLARKYFALNGVRPEFGSVFGNGTLVLRTKNDITSADLNKVLESASFRYNAELNMQVNDESVKIQIGVKDEEGKWSVQPDYTDTFGFLMNKATRATSGKGGAKASKAKAITDNEAKAYEIYNKLCLNQ